MEYKKRSLDEEVIFPNVCIGMKVDNFPGGAINISFKTFTMLERKEHKIGLVGKELLTIYEDMEEEKYSYVKPDGSVFIPKEKVPYQPSSHLRSVSEVKSFREIIQKAIEKSDDLPDKGESFQCVVDSWRKFEDQFKEAEELGMKAFVKLGEIKVMEDEMRNMYIFAFGNPLDRDEDFQITENSEIIVEEETEEFFVTDEEAQEARSRFFLINNEDDEVTRK